MNTAKDATLGRESAERRYAVSGRPTGGPETIGG